MPYEQAVITEGKYEKRSNQYIVLYLPLKIDNEFAFKHIFRSGKEQLR